MWRESAHFCSNLFWFIFICSVRIYACNGHTIHTNSWIWRERMCSSPSRIITGDVCVIFFFYGMHAFHLLFPPCLAHCRLIFSQRMSHLIFTNELQKLVQIFQIVRMRANVDRWLVCVWVIMTVGELRCMALYIIARVCCFLLQKSAEIYRI